MDGQELDGRDAEVDEMRDRSVRSKARVRATEIVPDALEQLRESLDVELVDHGLVPRSTEKATSSPSRGPACSSWLVAAAGDSSR